jgi:hypothetical protein
MSDFRTTATPRYVSEPIGNPIALSPNYATGLVIGVFLALMVAFAAYMMLNIQTSDTMSVPEKAYELPEKKRD